MFASMSSSIVTPLKRGVLPRSSGRSGPTRVTCATNNNKSRVFVPGRSQSNSSQGVFFTPLGGRRGSTSFGRNAAISVQSPDASTSEFEPPRNGSSDKKGTPKTPVMTFTAEELAQRDATAFSNFRQQEAKRRMLRKPWKEMKFKEQFEYAFVRLTLTMSGGFVLLGVVASLILSALLFSMGMKEVVIDAARAWMHYNPVELVASAVGALDRFLLGMVCLVFGLGNREGEVRDAKLKKLSWLRVSSIDDLEQKVGEIIVAVMVVNLLEMSLHMKYTHPVDLVWAALAAVMSAGALALLHFSSGATHGHGH